MPHNLMDRLVYRNVLMVREGKKRPYETFEHSQFVINNVLMTGR